MELHQKLKNALTEYQTKDPSLQGWRFDLHRSKGIEVGLKNNQIGGPYTAPSYKRSISGELYLVWQGSKFTSTKLDLQSIDNFAEYMETWKTTAYLDPDGVGITSPGKVPEVPLNDPETARIIADNTNQPFELLDYGLAKLLKYGMKKIDGRVRCYQDHRVIMNSQGFQLEYLQTPVDFFFEVNDSYGESYQEKKWPDPAEIERIIDNTGNIGGYLEKGVDRPISGKFNLLLPPGIWESFFSQFVITNLYGSLVVNRQSRYVIQDFLDQKQVIRPDLDLEVNTLKPFRAFSYPCTAEGVPGGQIKLISNGKLQTPILNLKYSQKAAMPPTPVPSGQGFFLKTHLPRKTWDNLVKDTEFGVIVYSVLGLHTQDSTSGQFSLTADQCLLVENGEIKGKITGVINGDFITSLTLDTSEFADYPGEDNPGYKMIASFSR